MPRRVPPLEAIEAFVSVAHFGGVRAAAGDLNLDSSGVSRRIATLESFLGRRLFDRTDQGVELNAAGARYLEMVAPAIAAIHRASNRLEGNSDRLVLATSHSIANRWLMPRLARLQKAASVELEILPTRDPDVVRSGEAHIGIWGSLDAPDLETEPLLQVRTCPVSAPMLVDGTSAPEGKDQLPDYPLLSVKQPSGLWPRWLAAAGVERSPSPVVEFATMGLMYEAAAAGLGVALAVPMMCETQLKTGALAPCGPALPIGESYKLFRARGRGGASVTEAKITHCLRREIAGSVALFDSIAAT